MPTHVHSVAIFYLRILLLGGPVLSGCWSTIDVSDGNCPCNEETHVCCGGECVPTATGCPDSESASDGDIAALDTAADTESASQVEWDTEYLVPYDCRTGDSASCDALACGFKATMEEILERSSRYNPSLHASTHACLSTFDDCLFEACPPESKASSWQDSRACSSNFSICLTESATRGIASVPYQELDLMPGSPDTYASGLVFRCGPWYKFADSDEEGPADSKINYYLSEENDEPKACVFGVASQEKEGRDAVYWGAGCGGDLRACDEFEDTAHRFIGVTFDIKGHWGAELRVLFHEYPNADRYPEESAYIVVPKNAAHVTALVDQADVWYHPDNMVHVEHLSAIQFHVATNPQAATPFDFCITGLTALFSADEGADSDD